MMTQQEGVSLSGINVAAMEYITVGSTEQRILCCQCGVVIAPNAANMCVDCIRNEVDITEGIPKQLTLYWCKFCERYLQPPSQWVTCQLESRELLSLCLKKIRGLNKVRLIDAGFVWTEPHSKRVKVKLTIQKEVFVSTILQQAFVVEFIIASQVCESCHRTEAKDTWRAVVQVRQKVSHKRTFFYLEQLILKHGIHRGTTNIKEVADGIDFYFAHRNQAVKLNEFLQSVVPTRSKSSQELVSFDEHTSTASYKSTISTEIVPICKDDAVCMPQKLRNALGCTNPIMVCDRVGTTIHLVDPSTLQAVEVSTTVYWRAPFLSLCSNKDLVEFVVLDVELLGPTRGRYALADVQLARVSDFGKNDVTFYGRTHLGRILQAGDQAFGYDLAVSNFNNEDFDKLNDKDLPDIILVKKSYPNRRRKQRPRMWQLKRLTKTEAENSKKKDATKADDDYEQFLRELEEDKDLRSSINLFKNPVARVPIDTVSVAGTEGEPAEDDFPEVQLDELLDEMTLDDKDAPPDMDDDDLPDDVIQEP